MLGDAIFLLLSLLRLSKDHIFLAKRKKEMGIKEPNMP